MEKQSVVAGAELPELVAMQEERLRMLGEANARLVRGMLNVWQRELELGQELISENFADPKVITEVFAGNVEIGGHWPLAQRRFERAVAGLRRINDEFYGCLFEAAATATGNGTGAKAAQGNGGTEDAGRSRSH